MNYKRRALGALSRVELLDVGQALGIRLGREMSLSEMQDVTAASEQARLEDILPRLPRNTLKAVCDVLGLDPTSRGKGPLVDRILTGAEPTSDRTPSGVPGAPRSDAAA